MTLGERIRKLRAARGWGMARLAEDASVSRSYIWQLETGGKDRPSLDVLERIAGALGVSVAEFSEQQAREEAVTDRLPPGLAEFIRRKSKELQVLKGDLEVLRNIHFRGVQPRDPEDWELLFLFLKKWAR
ncbi:MAG: helix-turn-helix domain-containing protein [Candidatus Hydrogenedentes bacterium]|nr:helix-turn-helix domain-containing protein [Candidatus Hydrogenedentota bacterium]